MQRDDPHAIPMLKTASGPDCHRQHLKLDGFHVGMRFLTHEYTNATKS